MIRGVPINQLYSHPDRQRLNGDKSLDSNI